MLAAAMSSAEQKNGLRYALALAVVFCLNEVQWLNLVKSQFQEGHQPSYQIVVISSLFPEYYCLFEKIFIMHLIYLMLFNVICTFAKNFGLNEHKEKIGYVRQIIQNQSEIEASIREIYYAHTGKVFDRNYLRKEQKDYTN